MKREGRQHGLVATACVPQCKSLDQHQDVSCRRHRHQQQPTAGIFTRVPQKPTNHSKYTSRCPRPRCPCCHTFPAGKAKDKTKGSQKAISFNVVTNYRLVTWRVADARPGLKLSGSSVARILDHLENDYDEGEEEEDQILYDDDDEYDGQQQSEEIELMINPNPNPRIAEIEQDLPPVCGGGDSDRDGLSYCNVGIIWEQVNAGGDENEEVEVEVEGWCLVQEF